MFICRVSFKVSNTDNQIVLAAKDEEHCKFKMKRRCKKYVYKVKTIKFQLLI